MRSSAGSISSGPFPRRRSIWRGFSSRRASHRGRSHPFLDARGRNERASRCDRQCLRPLRGRAAGPAVPDAGLALRHRARRRQMGRAARPDHGDLLRRRSQQAGQAIAVRDRGDRASPTKRACASPRRCSAAARSRAHSSRACSIRATTPASRCARRWSGSASIPTISARPHARAANCSPMSNCISSRGRCWNRRTCRSAW